jgi:hypothetical protein
MWSNDSILDITDFDQSLESYSEPSSVPATRLVLTPEKDNDVTRESRRAVKTLLNPEFAASGIFHKLTLPELSPTATTLFSSDTSMHVIS